MAAAGGGGDFTPDTFAVFTANDTWNWPPGVTAAKAEAIGGGGGGGGASGNPATGGGGKGGGYARRALITKGAESSLAIVVGAGGTAGAAAAGTGGAGGVSSVTQGSTVVLRASGGAGGVGAASDSTNGAGGTTENGTPEGSTTNFGGNGGTGDYTATTGFSGPGGGSGGPTSEGSAPTGTNIGADPGTGAFLNGLAYQIKGANGVGGNSAGANGGVYGAGGSGGKANNATDRAGGAGGGGIVLLSWVAAAGDPLAITTTSLPGGTVGVAYDQTVAATGGTSPYTFTLQSGSLPNGLTLETTGQIHGTPTTADVFVFTVLVTDSVSGTDTQELSITVVGGGGGGGLPATDPFTGTNGDPLSANWTTLLGSFQVASNRIRGQSGVDSVAFWNANTFANDQYAQVVFVYDSGYYGGPVVRAAATRGYWARVINDTTMQLYRIDNASTFTQLQQVGSLSIANGDVLRLEAEGTTLRMYQNGTQRGTDQTDATYSSGAAGIATWLDGAHLDDFEGGNLTGGGDPTPSLPCSLALLGVGKC